MTNVPDDWNSYWRNCTRCGRRYHESEGCDCPELCQSCSEPSEDLDATGRCEVCAAAMTEE